MIELRPLELGAIVDRATTLWRGNWRRLYGVFFAFSIAQYALLKIATLVMRHFAPLASGGQAMLQAAKENSVELLKQEGIAGGTFILMMVIVLFVSLVETAAATRYLMPTLLGQKAPEPIAGVRHALGRLPTLLALFWLAMGWSIVVLLGFLLPAFLLGAVAAVIGDGPAQIIFLILAVTVGMFSFIGWFLWFILRFSIWGQVSAMEDIGALAIFRRTGQLTSGRVGPGFFGFVKVRLAVLITIIGLMLTMLSLVSGAPALILQAVYGNIFDPLHADPNAVPQVLLVPAELLNVAVQAIVAPLYVALQVVFYVDVRTRREGLDLELKLQEGSTPA